MSKRNPRASPVIDFRGNLKKDLRVIKDIGKNLSTGGRQMSPEEVKKEKDSVAAKQQGNDSSKVKLWGENIMEVVTKKITSSGINTPLVSQDPLRGHKGANNKIPIQPISFPQPSALRVRPASPPPEAPNQTSRTERDSALKSNMKTSTDTPDEIGEISFASRFFRFKFYPN